MMKLFSKNSNLCDHNSPTLQTDGQTDRQTTCDRKTALCTKVHRAVKTRWLKQTWMGGSKNRNPRNPLKFTKSSLFNRPYRFWNLLKSTTTAANIIRPAYMDCWWDWSRLKFKFLHSSRMLSIEGMRWCGFRIRSTGFRGSRYFRGCLRWI